MRRAAQGARSGARVSMAVAMTGALLAALHHDSASAQGVPDPREIRLAQLEDALHENELALDSANTPWPYIMIGAGVGVGIGAGFAGMAIAAGCEGDDCNVSAAVGLLAVAGLAVLTAGVIWWRLQEQTLRRLESKQYQLERDLERLKLTLPTSTPKGTAGLSWRFHF